MRCMRSILKDRVHVYFWSEINIELLTLQAAAVRQAHRKLPSARCQTEM
jgi:hypothetical protein